MLRRLAAKGTGTLGVRAPWRAYSSDSCASSSIDQMAQAASKSDLDGLLNVVEAAGDSFDCKAVEAALRQVETCTRNMAPEELQQKLHGSKTFQMLADMAVSSAGRASPEVLASTIGVLGRLGFGDQMVLDSLARHLMPGVQHLKAEQMSELVEGLKRADHSPSVLLLDEVHERLNSVEVEDTVPDQQANAIRQGLQQLGRAEGNPPNEAGQSQPDRIKYT